MKYKAYPCFREKIMRGFKVFSFDIEANKTSI